MTATKGFVVPAGGGKPLDSPTPGRSFSLKLLGHETDESIMMFEETLPAGTASLYHLHRDSDEVAWVLAGEFTFKIGDEVAAGGPGTCAFMPRDRPACLEEHRQRNRPRPVSLHPGRRRRLHRGTLGAPPNRRRRTQQAPRALPLGGRRPKPALRWAFARETGERDRVRGNRGRRHPAVPPLQAEAGCLGAKRGIGVSRRVPVIRPVV